MRGGGLASAGRGQGCKLGNWEGTGALVQVCTLTPWLALLYSAHSSCRGGAGSGWGLGGGRREDLKQSGPGADWDADCWSDFVRYGASCWKINQEVGERWPVGICGGDLLSSRKELFPHLFFRWEGGSLAAFPSSLAVFIGWGFGKKTRVGWSSWDRNGQHKGGP